MSLLSKILHVSPARRWTAAFLAWVFVAGTWCGSAKPAEEASLESLDTLASDVLTLIDGERLYGELLNTNLVLRTVYAQIQLNPRRLVSVRLAEANGGLYTVLTVESNQLTGFIENRSLTFQASPTNSVQIPRERVVGIDFRPPAQASPRIEQGTWVRLRNGDLVVGHLSPDPLTLVVSNQQLAVAVADFSYLRLSLAQGLTAQGVLREGKPIDGDLAQDSLSLELGSGQKIALYAEAVDSFANSRKRLLAPEPRSRSKSVPYTTNSADLVWISPGEFLMGSPFNEQGRDPDEGPQTKASIPHGFWMGRHEVTQAEYEDVMGTNPSLSTADPNRPVDRVNWFEAMEYCARLTKLQEGARLLPKGYAFRLPTEAEWEYCCRAGSTTRYCFGEDLSDSDLSSFAWFTRNSDFMSHPVGTKKPNAWGLYDMHGNVWEWCLNRWDGPLPGGSITNTPKAEEGGLRVARGGSWLYEAKACRSANRDDYGASNRCSDVGFRVVLAPTRP
jgi:formylglycine-generating enzyme required for sulfatase activity